MTVVSCQQTSPHCPACATAHTAGGVWACLPVKPCGIQQETQPPEGCDGCRPGWRARGLCSRCPPRTAAAAPALARQCRCAPRLRWRPPAAVGAASPTAGSTRAASRRPAETLTKLILTTCQDAMRQCAQMTRQGKGDLHGRSPNLGGPREVAQARRQSRRTLLPFA